MRKSSRSRTLTGTVTVHVKPDEDELIKERAAHVGLTKSEWCRNAILQSLEASWDSRLIVAELLALRKIFLLLQIDSYQGKKLSEQRLRSMVDEAEATKFAMAASRIRGFWAQIKGEAREERKGD